MSSRPQRQTLSTPHETHVPYASYAQLVRMLLPLTGKVSFYDRRGEVLWISDGLEEPELRMHVEIVLSRFAHDRDSVAVDDIGNEHGQPTYVFPICDATDTLVGAMAIVFRDLPTNTTYRNFDTVHRLLAPLLDILCHGWRVPREAPAPSLPAAPVEEPLPLTPLEEHIDAATPLPAALRRTLALATHRLNCAFGALIVTGESFTLTHRASPDESDLTMNAAIETVRGPMLRLLDLRKQPLLVNGAGTRHQTVPYKCLALPIRPTAERLGAALLLFRGKQAPDFTNADVATLMQVMARLPDSVLAQLAPPPVREAVAAPPPKPAAPPARAVRPPPIPPAIVVPPQAPPRAAATGNVPLVITADAAPTMDDRIRAALRNEQFDLYVQPISSLRDARRPARFEVLLRMKDADRVRAPASFFEAAEAGTLMPELDRWVIRRLLGTLRQHAETVRSGRWEFCINIAGQSLVADRFSEFLVAEVCRSSIPAGLLVFEVSESSALEHQHAVELLGARLRDVGCRIALDNCRAGLATFGPLHKWPVSCVKIDGSLINRLGNPRSESVVRAVTELAANMGIETVAERVESSDVHNKLLEIGLDYAQGFHFGQPQPLATVFQ